MVNARIGDLSERQRQCLRLVAELKTTKQIAGELNIAPSTVDTHIQRAIELLGVATRADAAKALIAADALAGEESRPQQSTTEPSRLPPNPFPSAIQPSSTAEARPARNQLSAGARIGVAALALVMLCLAVAGLGAAIEKLSDWRWSIAQARQERGLPGQPTGDRDGQQHQSSGGGRDQG